MLAPSLTTAHNTHQFFDRNSFWLVSSHFSFEFLSKVFGSQVLALAQNQILLELAKNGISQTVSTSKSLLQFASIQKISIFLIFDIFSFAPAQINRHLWNISNVDGGLGHSGCCQDFGALLTSNIHQWMLHIGAGGAATWRSITIRWPWPWT